MVNKELKREKVMRYIETRDEKLSAGKSWHLRTKKKKLLLAKAYYNEIKSKKKGAFGKFFKKYDQTLLEATEKEIKFLSKMTNEQLDLALLVMEKFKYKEFGEVQLIAIAEFHISNWVSDQIYKPYQDEKSSGHG